MTYHPLVEPSERDRMPKKAMHLTVRCVARR